MRNLRFAKRLLISAATVGIGLFSIPAAIAASLTISPTTLPAATVGSAYTATFTASGGKAPYTWSISTGSAAPTGLKLSAAGVLSGTPTTPSGTAATTFIVDVHDSSATELTGSATIAILINPDPLAISTVSLPTGVDSVAYSAPLSSTGGTGTVTWKLAAGSTLVKGLTLSAAGVVSGKPTASTNGPGNFSVVATDSASPVKHTATATIKYVINPENGKFLISTTQFASATVGNAYSASLTTSGGVAPITFSLIDSTSLPPGLALAATGAITGVPTAATMGTNFWVQATDSSATPLVVTAFLGIIVAPSAIGVSPLALPPATLGKAYSQTLTATGGTAPYAWSIASGSAAPAGLKLSAAGVLSGTPTALSGPTPATFVVQVSDSASPKNTDFATLSLPVNAPPLTITTTSLAGGTVGLAYSKTLAAKGGAGTYTWSVASGSAAPPGLSLSAAGVLSGIPTVASGSTATTFVAQVADSESTPMVATGKVSIKIAPSAVKVTTLVLPPATVGSQYSDTLAATGGKSPYSWQIAPGSNPPGGLTLSSAGVLSGTPATPSGANPTTFVVEVTDSTSPTRNTDFATISLTVNPAPLVIASTSLAAATVGVQYSATLAATGGVPPYSWMIAAGSNPPGGLSLSPAGVLSGDPTTPSGANPTTFVAQVTDSESTPRSVTATVSIQINPAASPLAVVTTTLPPAYLNTSFTTQLSASGGTPPYTWSLASGSAAPAGLTLAKTGVLSGKPTTVSEGDPFSVTVKDSSSPVNAVTAKVTAFVYPAVAQCANNGSGNSKLKGRYSLLLDTLLLGVQEHQWTLGAFTADGAGNLTAGIFDTNGPNLTAAQSGTFTGKYSVGPDNRGLLTITIPASGGNPAATRSVCIALDSIQNGVAGGGHLVEDDESERNAAGALYLQPATAPTLASIAGSWVLSLEGGQIPGDGNPETRHSAAGYLTFNASGSVTGGEIDQNDTEYSANGELVENYTPELSVSGNLTIAGTGRGTLALSVGGGPTANVAYYVTASNGILLLRTDNGIEPDGENNVVYVGKAIERTTSIFDDATLTGASVFFGRGNAILNSEPAGRSIQLGILNWSGTGTYSGASDVNNAGNVTLATKHSYQGTYSVDSNGRVAVASTTGGPGFTFYLIGPNEGLGLGGGLGSSVFTVLNQAPPAGGFTLSSVTGAYSHGTIGYAFDEQIAQSGVYTSSGGGAITGTVDLNGAGQVKVGASDSYTYTAGANGRFELTAPSDTAPSLAVYAVNPNLLYVIDIGGDAWSPIDEEVHQ